MQDFFWNLGFAEEACHELLWCSEIDDKEIREILTGEGWDSGGVARVSDDVVKEKTAPSRAERVGEEEALGFAVEEETHGERESRWCGGHISHRITSGWWPAKSSYDGRRVRKRKVKVRQIVFFKLDQDGPCLSLVNILSGLRSLNAQKSKEEQGTFLFRWSVEIETRRNSTKAKASPNFVEFFGRGCISSCLC